MTKKFAMSELRTNNEILTDIQEIHRMNDGAYRDAKKIKTEWIDFYEETERFFENQFNPIYPYLTKREKKDDYTKLQKNRYIFPRMTNEPNKTTD